jgi:GNAT superfamily N-acetyltransferase
MVVGDGRGAKDEGRGWEQSRRSALSGGWAAGADRDADPGGPHGQRHGPVNTTASTSAALSWAVVILRPATASDVDALQAVTIAAYERYVPRLGRRPAPMDIDYSEAVGAGRVWAALYDDLIVGLGVLVPKQDHLLLDNIAVVPSAQGQGIGGLLLALAEEHARRLGLTEVRLYTNEAMTENLAYYPRRGYVESHRAEQDGFRRVFFRKLVTP